MKVALVVGVEEYEKGSGITPLRFARKDAARLGEVLKNVCDFEVRVLDGERGTPKWPTRQAVFDALREFEAGPGPIEHFLFAFSGHGMMKVGSAYLTPADARRNAPGTHIALADFFFSLEQIRAEAFTLILDCCRNDPEAGKGDRPNLFQLDIAKDLAVNRNGQAQPPFVQYTMTACADQERAYEDEEREHGAFFYHLLEGIKGPAWKTNGLSVNEAFEYAKTKVEASYDGQHPQFVATNPSRISYLAVRTPQEAQRRLEEHAAEQETRRQLAEDAFFAADRRLKKAEGSLRSASKRTWAWSAASVCLGAVGVLALAVGLGAVDTVQLGLSTPTPPCGAQEQGTAACASSLVHQERDARVALDEEIKEVLKLLDK